MEPSNPYLARLAYFGIGSAVLAAVLYFIAFIVASDAYEAPPIVGVLLAAANSAVGFTVLIIVLWTLAAALLWKAPEQAAANVESEVLPD